MTEWAGRCNIQLVPKRVNPLILVYIYTKGTNNSTLTLIKTTYVYVRDKKKGTYLCNWTKSWRFATVLEGLFGESHSSSAALGSVQMSPGNHVVRDWSVPSVRVDV